MPSTRPHPFSRCGVVLLLIVSVATPAAGAFTDLVVFGDSLSDIGNIASATLGSQPGPFYFDDRFSNGPVYSEMLATELGVGPLVRSTASGNNYAYGGAQTTGTGGLAGFVIRDIDEQVDLYLGSNTPDADALYMVFAGANDLLADQIDVTTPAASLASDIDRLIMAGARQLLVLNLPRFGTVPRFNGDPVQAAAMNTATLDYNSALSTQLDTLETTYPATTFFRFDTAALFDTVIADPASYGFANVTESAAPGLEPGAGSYDTGLIVPDPSVYLFWDDLHPTTAVHALLAQEVAAMLLPPSATPGDGNGDGKVDGLDYLVWAGHFGDDPAVDPPGAPENGDFNDDGLVNGLDYLVWATGFGTGPNDTLAVPEPASLLLLLVASVAVLWQRQRWR